MIATGPKVGSQNGCRSARLHRPLAEVLHPAPVTEPHVGRGCQRLINSIAIRSAASRSSRVTCRPVVEATALARSCASTAVTGTRPVGALPAAPVGAVRWGRHGIRMGSGSPTSGRNGSLDLRPGTGAGVSCAQPVCGYVDHLGMTSGDQALEVQGCFSGQPSWSRIKMSSTPERSRSHLVL